MICLNACKDRTIPANFDLTGKWIHTLEYRTKDLNGKWGEWTKIDQSPSLTFQKNGDLLWDDKNTAPCCMYKSYQRKGDKITLSNEEHCPLAYCLFCNEWIIKSFDGQLMTLENSCGTREDKYLKASQ